MLVHKTMFLVFEDDKTDNFMWPCTLWPYTREFEHENEIVRKWNGSCLILIYFNVKIRPNSRIVCLYRVDGMHT